MSIEIFQKLNPMHASLLVILMPIPKIGGQMVTPTQKVLHSITFFPLFNLCEPTNFEENKSPSCIDLIISDQPNVVMESGLRPSPDNVCKHQMTFCNLNLHLPPPVYSRKMWHYNRANSDAMTKAVTDFPWTTHLTNLDPLEAS